MASDARKPDYNLHAMDPDNICKGRVGAGWLNDDGSISIKLQPYVVLSAIDDVKIRLFPVDEEGYKDRQRERERASASTPPGTVTDIKKPKPRPVTEDDIPF